MRKQILKKESAERLLLAICSMFLLGGCSSTDVKSSTPVSQQAANEQPDPNNAYINPTVGISLQDFKTRFNKRISAIAPKLKIRGPGEETTTVEYFCYPFTENTILSVYTNDKTQVEHIELDSVSKDASKFWSCADATITALNSGSEPSEVRSILTRLGRGNGKVLTAANVDLDIGSLHYGYYPEPGNCVLNIQSNKP